MLSMLRQGMTRTVSSIFLWGVATSPERAVTLVLVPLMPSGVKIRVFRKSPQDIPLAAATTSPAARNMMF